MDLRVSGVAATGSECEMPSKILLVDDNEDIVTSLTSFLEKKGYEVQSTDNGEMALYLIEILRPDLVILDVELPEMNGTTVLYVLRTQRQDWTPVILLTKHDKDADEAMGLDMGADDYLSKPFSRLVLDARIRRVLARGKPVRFYHSGDMRLDAETHRLWLREQELTLQPQEILLLRYMMRHSNRLLTYEELRQELWGWSEGSRDRIRICINAIRDK